MRTWAHARAYPLTRMAVSEYFSPDYRTARVRFREAAQQCGAQLSEYLLPAHQGPHGESLAVDVAQLGAAEPDRALLVISGTHGVEGLCGAGCQLGLLQDRLGEVLPGSTRLLLVHALNPYGFAWLRRVTEEGIDLNRNFVDFAQPLPSSAAYEALHEWLVPQDWDGPARAAADAALGGYLQKYGARALQEAVQAGQYSRPTGLFYGGAGPSWSARALERILEESLPRSVRTLAVLDLHTGLGPPGYGEPILTRCGPADVERAQRWYGPEVKDLSGGKSVSAQVLGSLADGIARLRPSVQLTFLALEFGTRPMLEVLTALRGDHCLHAAGGGESALRRAVRQQMRAAFFSDSPAWQAAVYGRTADFFYRACRGLGAA